MSPDFHVPGVMKNLTVQVGILWDLCEWQMADPARFRALLKSEEESNQWVSLRFLFRYRKLADSVSVSSRSDGTKKETPISSSMVS